MATDIQHALSGMQQFRSTPWAAIPDFGLYMDQVITLIGQQYLPLYGEDMRSYLSAPMINNYVKSKLIPRPTGKKYSREQIALLSMIVVLKQVSSMEDIRRMLSLRDGDTVEQLYTRFCLRFDRVIHSIQSGEAADAAELTSALDFAILASGYHAGCSAILKSGAPAAVQ